jgi:hypothetical protein
MPGAATQIFSAEFDAALARLPKNIAALIMGKMDDMGRRLDSFPHYRMTPPSLFRVRLLDSLIVKAASQAQAVRIFLLHSKKPSRSV